MKNLKGYLLLFGLVIVVVAILSIRPIPGPAEGNFGIQTGELTSVVKGGGPDDILLFLKNDERCFYINRGGAIIDTDSLRMVTTDKVVTVLYSNHWSPLDPSGDTRHVYALEVEGKRIYDEFK